MGGQQHAVGMSQPMGPSAEDVTFGRACLAFGLVTRERLLECVADQRHCQNQGRPVTLAQVLIGRQLITADQYRRLVERIRQHWDQARQVVAPPGAPPAPPPPPLPPEITASGRYAGAAIRQLNKEASDVLPAEMVAPVREAGPGQVVDWQRAPSPSAADLQAATRSWEDASSAIEASYEVVAEPPGAPVASPQAVRDRRDDGIRKLLGIDEHAQEFDFGPYRILGEVAAGGMGIIYRARAEDTGRVYALKALINVENATEKQLRRFIQEAQSAMRLDHPGIVKIHDLGIFENVPYFTMDLVDGQDLHQHLRRNTFAMGELLEVVLRVAEAVHYAHEHGVIHRDLKPANIIIRAADHFPVLTDFGLAKNLDSTFKLTAEGAMVGTPLFLSPEQVSGKAQQVDRRCDVYGLGVMLYQILTGTLPFVGRNPYEVYKKVLEEDPTPPTQVNPAVAPDLEKICLMALAKDREERYPTAQELADDLRRHLRGEPVRAKLPTPAAVAKARNKDSGPPAAGDASRKQRGNLYRDAGAERSQRLTMVIIAVTIVLIALGLTTIAYVATMGAE